MVTFEYVDLELDGVKQWLKIAGDNAFEDIADGWCNYRNTILQFVKNRNVAVQAGGYCGIFPRCLSNLFEVVYTFEPDPVNFHCAVNNTPVANIIKFQAALGNDHEMISMAYMHPNNAGMKKAVKTNQSIIPTIRIDDLNLPACDLIMLDTEGYEYNAIMGGQNTIRKYKPMITAEDSNKEIEDFLFPLGYKNLATIYRDTVYGV